MSKSVCKTVASIFTQRATETTKQKTNNYLTVSSGPYSCFRVGSRGTVVKIK